MIAEILRAQKIFSELASLDEAVFPLDRAALALAMMEYPNLDMAHYLRKLDTLAARTEVLVGTDRTPVSILNSLNEILFVQEGLRGNNEDYFDPRNSFINQVLDRKQGIPISLSIIYIEVARRISFRIHGVGLPGHFLVKHVDNEREILVDPFNMGRILTIDNCQEILDRIYGKDVQMQPTFLLPMENRAIISRMLFNLKGIYFQKEEYHKALPVVERILMLSPGVLTEIRDRGLLLMQASLFAEALADLEYYLANATAPEDAENIRAHVRILRSLVACSN